MAEQVEILRDRWGIAHVYGDSEEAAFYGYGYAMAEDRIFQMALRRRVVQGRVAEILGAGPGNRFVQQDRKSRIFAFHRRARDTVAKLPAEMRRYLGVIRRGRQRLSTRPPRRVGPSFYPLWRNTRALECSRLYRHLGSPRPALQLWLGKRSTDDQRS